MALRKKVISGTTSKGKSKMTARGENSKQISNQPFTKGTAYATLQEQPVSTQVLQQHEDQLFQMLREMKE